MSENERPILEEVLDYAVYAPVGLALTLLEDLPSIIERGKDKLATQVGVARFAGRLAFGQVKRALDDILVPSQPSVTDAFGHDGPPASPEVNATEDALSGPAAARRQERSATGRPLAPDLAIPGYDTLAASQIVSRLDALQPDELTAIRIHEEQHRGRRTILARIAQLDQSHHGG